MAKKDKGNALPSTGAGLVRYFDEENTGPKVSPEVVVIITMILGVFCFILNFSTK